MLRIGLLLVLLGWAGCVWAQAPASGAGKAPAAVKTKPKPTAKKPGSRRKQVGYGIDADSVQQIFKDGEWYAASYGQPELLGRFVDRVGNCTMILYANGTGSITYTKDSTQQDIKWGLKLNPDRRRYQFIDEDGVDSHEFMMEHYGGQRVFTSRSGNYSPSVLSRDNTPVLIFYEQEWYLERVK